MVESLRGAILSGEFKPGEHLHQSQLAARFGISPTPLRDALLRLEADGLVRIDQRRNARVIALNPDDIRETYEIRLALEPIAARRSIRRADDDQTHHLVQLCETMDRNAHDAVLGQQSRRSFYDEFYRLSGAPRMHNVIMRMRDEVTIYHVNAGVPAEHAHLRLRQLIIDRDADGTADHVAEHLAHARDDLLMKLEIASPE